MSRSYLDHASTSPLRPQARDAMVDALTRLGGDPGRIHEEGMAARVALEGAREQVASLFGARSREVVFTSGATESIATAIWGATQRARQRSGDTDSAVHHVVTAVEHSAVRLSAAQSGSVTVVPVDGGGRVDAAAVLEAIRPDTAAVHVQWANHEVATVQPVAEIAAGCREAKVLLHVDAAQAAGRVAIDFSASGIDLMSVSGHKLGGPIGTGALLIRRGLRLPPLLVGGDQERARRAGLEPVAQLVGFGAACEALSTQDRLASEAHEARRLAAQIRTILDGIEGITSYGDPDHRLAQLVCVGVEGVEPQAVLLGLDRAGIAAHSGSACSSESLEPSPVLEAMGVDAHHSLRLSVGWNTTDDDIDRLARALPQVIGHLRSLAR